MTARPEDHGQEPLFPETAFLIDHTLPAAELQAAGAALMAALNATDSLPAGKERDRARTAAMLALKAAVGAK